ncbi:MAG TPA: TetR/AcrR family transcriptional regulator [Candidatus Cybelea sp.]|nr:TetR/AcrR family transcriptional regulator [Candidatus Cybelea sp.]
MSPRPYQAGERRKAATQATRSRIIEAARELLADPQESAFSIDAVAQRADVARMTVYYQFKSKAKLLEALFDDFAARANVREVQKAFQEPSAERAVGRVVDVFCNLWKTQGALVRRLNAMAILDPEVGEALRERQSWRREVLARVVGGEQRGKARAEVVDLLFVLTSFETYDMLAGGRTPKAVATTLKRAATAVLTPDRLH